MRKVSKSEMHLNKEFIKKKIHKVILAVYLEIHSRKKGNRNGHKKNLTLFGLKRLLAGEICLLLNHKTNNNQPLSLKRNKWNQVYKRSTKMYKWLEIMEQRKLNSIGNNTNK